MVFGRSSRPSDPDSPADVRKEFDTRIEQFFDHVGESSQRRILTRDEPLQRLFSLVVRNQTRQQETDHKLAWYVSDHAKLARSRKELLEANEELRTRLSKARSDIVSANDQMEQLTLRHSVTVADLETNLRDQRSAHGTALDRQEQDNERVVRHLKSEHEKKIKDADADHKAMIQALTTSQEEERNRLIGQLLVNQDNIQEWPDEKLKAKFLELQCIVGSIGSPQREELKFPQDIPVGPDLDPTGFFDRNKRGRGHFLVKRAVWAILCEHFFSVPFGFGVLGPENTQNELLSNFQEWRRLCRIGGPSQTEDAVDLTVFENDDLANRWRTISFRSIQDSGTVNLRSPIHELRAKNAASSTARIMQYLSAVASLTQHSINISVEDEVRKATQLAEEIALQFGVHPSKLLLRTADETWNGDPAPGLLKIGRDKNNTPTAQTVVPCKGSSDK